MRVCWESLVESPVRRSFIHVPGEVDIASEWAMFSASIVEAADQCCGIAATPAPAGGHRR